MAGIIFLWTLQGKVKPENIIQVDKAAIFLFAEPNVATPE